MAGFEVITEGEKEVLARELNANSLRAGKVLPQNELCSLRSELLER
jgi:hypothetical protein